MRSGVWSDVFTTAPKLARVIHARVQLMLTDFNSEWPRGHGKSVLDRDACRVQKAAFQICGPLGMIGFHMVGMDSGDPSLLFSWLPGHLAADLVSQCWSLIFGFGAVIQAHAAQRVVHVPAAPPSLGTC